MKSGFTRENQQEMRVEVTTDDKISVERKICFGALKGMEDNLCKHRGGYSIVLFLIIKKSPCWMKLNKY